MHSTTSRFARHSRPRLGLALVRWGVFLLAGCGWNVMGPSSCVGSVTVTPATATVEVGHQVQLYATVYDTGGRVLNSSGVTWAGYNSSVATVDQTGLVTGVSVGQATIYATSDAQSGSAQITVTAAAPPPPPPPGTPRTATRSSLEARGGGRDLSSHSPWVVAAR